MYICATSITRAYNMSTELEKAQKMLKQALKLRRSGKIALAMRLVVIAKRAIKHAMVYDNLNNEIGTEVDNFGRDMSEELESLYWKENYLYQQYSRFKKLYQRRNFKKLHQRRRVKVCHCNIAGPKRG